MKRKAGIDEMSMLRIYFFAHTSEGVTPKLYELMNWARVLSMELTTDGSNALAYEKELNSVSQRTKTPQEVLGLRFRDFMKPFLSKLFGSGRLVKCEESPISQLEFSKTEALSRVSIECWKVGDVESAIDNFMKYEIEFVDQTRRRDVSYADQLAKLLSNGNVKVLALRGPLHSRTLPPLLMDKRVDFEIFFYREPYILSKQEEVTLNAVCGRLPSREDIARCLIQQELQDNDQSYDTKLRVKKELDKMNSQDIEDLLETRKRSPV